MTIEDRVVEWFNGDSGRQRVWDELMHHSKKINLGQIPQIVQNIVATNE